MGSRGPRVHGVDAAQGTKAQEALIGLPASRSAMPYGVEALKVSHASSDPCLKPVLNHFMRCSDEPCVQDSLSIVPVACSWIRSSPTAAAASNPFLTSASVIDSTSD